VIRARAGNAVAALGNAATPTYAFYPQTWAMTECRRLTAPKVLDGLRRLCQPPDRRNVD